MARLVCVPELCGYFPVRMVALLGQQTGVDANAFVNSTPGGENIRIVRSFSGSKSTFRDKSHTSIF